MNISGYTLLTILCLLGGLALGYVFHHEILPNMGANHITPGDVIGCYAIGLVIAGIVWFLLILKLNK